MLSGNDLQIGDSNVFEMSYTKRALDMDVLDAPAGHVITGVKLRNLGGHLNLEARITPIDFETGLMEKDKSTWIGNDKTSVSKDRRTRVAIITPDIPTRYFGKNSIDSRNNQVKL